MKIWITIAVIVSVSIPENGVIPFEANKSHEYILMFTKVSIPENGVIPFEDA